MTLLDPYKNYCHNAIFSSTVCEIYILQQICDIKVMLIFWFSFLGALNWVVNTNIFSPYHKNMLPACLQQIWSDISIHLEMFL